MESINEEDEVLRLAWEERDPEEAELERYIEDTG